jgi:hypothetical protein
MRTRLTRLLVAPLLVFITGATVSLATPGAANAVPLDHRSSFGPMFGSYGKWDPGDKLVPHGVWSSGGLTSNYTCYAGTIPPGNYTNLLVAGICYTPFGNVTVKDNVTVAPGALLDAVAPGDPTSGPPVVPATVSVGGNIYVGKGGVLLLGCSPNISCGGATPGISFDHVRGSIDAFGAQGVVLHSVSVGGNVTVLGGGGGAAADTCNAQPPPPAPPVANLKPWSEDPNLIFTPVYTDVEDSSIGGNYTVNGLDSCWLGSLRNEIGGGTTFIGNTFGDPDAMEVGNNVINGNFTCYQNSPAPQFGEGAAPDIVAGNGFGQCGFDVVLQNPAQEAIELLGLEPAVGVSEHFVVSTRSLGTYYGTHGVTTVGSLGPPASPLTYPVITQAGDAVIAEVNNFTLSGEGITGTADYTGGPPGQSPGEAFLATAYPDGSASFVAYDNCPACSFDGQTGQVTLRAYGTISPSGFLTGTFIITSSGAVLPPGASAPSLTTLTGYGSFSGTGSTVNLVEHLGFG